MSPSLRRIRVYPVKSFDGKDLDALRINGGAGLLVDREYRFVDDGGRVVNSKRCGATLIPIRSQYDIAADELTLEAEGASVHAVLSVAPAPVEAWLSRRLGFNVHVERNAERGFPDDEEASGPTVVSESTLETVASWFPSKSVEEIRRRFRANLEIAGVPAFWEDKLLGSEGETHLFKIGPVRFEAVNPCARCVVPSLDSHSGEAPDPDFAKRFARLRAETLPEGVEPSLFDHFYRLSVNTRVPAAEDGKILSVGDPVAVL